MPDQPAGTGKSYAVTVTSTLMQGLILQGR
jgi:hypothetical protein